jgi:septation ring formation regulator EzrA
MVWFLLVVLLIIIIAAVNSGKKKTKLEIQKIEKEIKASPKTNVSVADELQKLSALRQQNVITEEEFQRQKRKILES